MNNKLMIITSDDDSLAKTIQSYFNNSSIYKFCDIDDSFIENCALVLELEMIVIDANTNQEDIESIVNIFSSRYPKIKLFLLVREDTVHTIFNCINKVHSICAQPICDSSLINRMVVTLSNHHNLKPIKEFRKAPASVNKNIEQFLDNYQGMMLFLKEDLKEYDTRIKSGDISPDLIESICSSLIQMADIFEKEEYISRVSPVFKEFSTFLSGMKIEDIPIHKLDGFEYLSMIIDDLSVYLEEMFVSRVFSDVHIFEDSLSNNISYFKKSISASENNNTEEDGDLDFF